MEVIIQVNQPPSPTLQRIVIVLLQIAVEWYLCFVWQLNNILPYVQEAYFSCDLEN